MMVSDSPRANALLGETAEQFGVSFDEFVNGGEKLSSLARFPGLEKIDELLHGLLLLRSQGVDDTGKLLGCHNALYLAVYRARFVRAGPAFSRRFAKGQETVSITRPQTSRRRYLCYETGAPL